MNGYGTPLRPPPLDVLRKDTCLFCLLLAIDSFTVISYNILSEKYATPQLFGYVPSWFINWEYRKQLIVHEILSYDPDIICLQVSRSYLSWLR